MYIIHIDLRHLTPIVVLFSGNTGTKWESFGWSCSSRSDGGWCRQWLRACGSVLQEIVHSCCHFASVCVRSGVVLVMRRTDSRGTAQRRTAYCLKWILSPEESFRWLFLHVWSKSAVQQLQTGLFRSSFNKNSRFSSDRCGLHSKRSLLSKAQERVKTQSHINELHVLYRASPSHNALCLWVSLHNKLSTSIVLALLCLIDLTLRTYGWLSKATRQ